MWKTALVKLNADGEAAKLKSPFTMYLSVTKNALKLMYCILLNSIELTGMILKHLIS